MSLRVFLNLGIHSLCPIVIFRLRKKAALAWPAGRSQPGGRRLFNRRVSAPGIHSCLHPASLQFWGMAKSRKVALNSYSIYMPDGLVYVSFKASALQVDKGGLTVS